MTWTWIDDGFTDRREVMALSAEAFRLHIEAMVYANRCGRDGALDRGDLRKLGNPGDGLLAELIGAALWEVTEDGWQLDWSEQETAAQVEERRAQWRTRDQRRRLHNKGDHSLCDPTRCWALTGEHTRETSRDSRPSHSHSHSPQEWEDAGDGSAGATPSRRGLKCPHGVTNGVVLGQCPEDECTQAWEDLRSAAEVAS